MAISDSNFDEPLNELRRQIQELEGFPPGSGQEKELDRLRHTLRKSTSDVYGGLNRWQKTLVARHQDRPYTLDYVQALMTDWVEIHGDRAFGDDPGHRLRVRHLPRPERRGHRPSEGARHQGADPAQLRPAAPRGLPQGAAGDEDGGAVRPSRCSPSSTPPAPIPGLDAEERGQAEAIARNLIEMAVLEVPIVVTVTGEGGSGGALALGVGDRVFMLEYATYSVISPEGCAAILWKDQDRKSRGRRGDEDHGARPPGPRGRRRDHPRARRRRPHRSGRRLPAGGGCRSSGRSTSCSASPTKELIARRYEKFRALGVYDEG